MRSTKGQIGSLECFEYQKPGGRIAFSPLDLSREMQGWAMRPSLRDTEFQVPQGSVASWLNVARGIITRGSNALVSPEVERWIAGVCGEVTEYDDDLGGFSFRSEPNRAWSSANPGRIPYQGIGQPREELCESEEEVQFLLQALPSIIGNHLSSMVVPQRPTDTMGPGLPMTQRVDFALEIGPEAKFVFEIDGGQHQDPTQSAADIERDHSLRRIGWKVTRIPAAAIRNSTLANYFEEIHVALSSLEIDSLKPVPSDNLSATDLTIWASYAAHAVHNFQVTLLHALENGKLPAGGSWKILAKERDLPIASIATTDLASLLSDLSVLWGLPFDVKGIKVWSDRDPFAERLGAYIPDGFLGNKEAVSTPDLIVDISTLGPALGAFSGETPDSYLIRPSYVTPDYLDSLPVRGQAQPLECNSVESQASLLNLLKRIFRKNGYLDGQMDILKRVLSQEPCIGLLPTGGGKSFCYQLAGLLQPGIILVIDPLVSLIKDQIEGLRSHGIDCVDGIWRGMDPQSRQYVQNRLWKGATRFLFVSPERLQTPDFRETLHQAAVTSDFSYVVIDEAHCVSEWGHDFRPAYLNVARNAKVHCKGRSGSEPTIIALTGTASRQVLQDIMRELHISEPEAVIEPTSFDRPELEFWIQHADQSERLPIVLAMINDLPRRLGMNQRRFFNPDIGGVVFTRLVRPGPRRTASSIDMAFPYLSSNLPGDIRYYSGGPPRIFPGDWRAWENTKNNTQTDFKNSQFPIMITTSAFGMGVDKSNVRWTVHLGIPSSLEAFYQEAGRAGRDHKKAICAILYSDIDRDDLNYFMEQAFPGQDQEIADAVRLCQLLVDKSPKIGERNAEIPISFSDKTQAPLEKALYRLGLVGVVNDYMVDYNAHQFIVDAQMRSESELRAALSQYGQTYLLDQREQLIQHFDKLVSLDGPVPAAVRVIVEEVYRTVRSRRDNAMNNMEELARIHAQGDGEGFRRDLLDYLQKSEWFDLLEAIARNEEDDPNLWGEIVEQTDDSIQWRGILGDCRRLRNDYPDSAALKILSGIGRVASQGSIPDAINDLMSALESIRARYGPEEAANQVIHIVRSFRGSMTTVENSCVSLLLAVLRGAEYIEPKSLVELSNLIGEEFDNETTRLVCLAVTGQAIARLAKRHAEEVLV